jgi:hypothetical protein
MKALIDGQVQILSSPQFRSRWASGGFPVHDVSFFEYGGLHQSSGWYIFLGFENGAGDFHEYYYGPFSFETFTQFSSALLGTGFVNNLETGEFFNLILRHQLYSKDILPP